MLTREVNSIFNHSLRIRHFECEARHSLENQPLAPWAGLATSHVRLSELRVVEFHGFRWTLPSKAVFPHFTMNKRVPHCDLRLIRAGDGFDDGNDAETCEGFRSEMSGCRRERSSGWKDRRSLDHLDYPCRHGGSTNERFRTMRWDDGCGASSFAKTAFNL
ncbi:hypothetical protein C8J56DRAFT_164279 [Mycena floridula]|nr:hypothetical protein C8J56DRAFT_164279 [Mycena floridula]